MTIIDHDHVLAAAVGAPVVLALLGRLVRGRQHPRTEFLRGLRDLLTLRMVLRDTAPEERAELLGAHLSWRLGRSGRGRS
ncbi:hypothetical protein AB0O22_25690 [Streptomyces sp. NPDC091204]|uniref:hypothetical protein n=1 Tax=Streptomyces sp. NPDC091204 TaxID=3155299 RepID=UPI0034221C3C